MFNDNIAFSTKGINTKILKILDETMFDGISSSIKVLREIKEESVHQIGDNFITPIENNPFLRLKTKGGSVVLKGKNIKPVVLKNVGKEALFIGKNKIMCDKIIIMDKDDPSKIYARLYIYINGDSVEYMKLDVDDDKTKKMLLTKVRDVDKLLSKAKIKTPVEEVEGKKRKLTVSLLVKLLLKGMKTDGLKFVILANTLYKALLNYKSMTAVSESDYNSFSGKINLLFDDSIEINRHSRMLSELKFETWLRIGRALLGSTVLLSIIIPLAMFMKFMLTLMSIKIHEMSASTVEKKEFQTMGQKIADKVLKEYAQLLDILEIFLSSKNLNGLLIYGPPGVGKTLMVNRYLLTHKIPYEIIRGSMSDNVIDFCRELYVNRNKKVIVLDDFDKVIESTTFIQLMKAMTDTYYKRIITVPKAAEMSMSKESSKFIPVPKKFILTAKIILITNKDRDEIDSALISRMIGLRVAFSHERIVKLMREALEYINTDMSMKEKEQVLAYLAKVTKDCKAPLDFRVLRRALDIYASFKDKWRQIVKEMVCAVGNR